MATPPARRPSPLARIRSVIRRFRAGHRWGPVSGLDLWQRSLGFAALGFLTLVPLLIVVSAAAAGSGKGFGQWLGDGLGVSEAARVEIERLFALPGQVRRTTTAFGLVLLAVFGLSFGTVVQSGYEKVWGLPRPGGGRGGGTSCGSPSSSGPSTCSRPPRSGVRPRSGAFSACSAAPCSSGGRSGCCSAAASRGAPCCPERSPRCSACSG